MPDYDVIVIGAGGGGASAAAVLAGMGRRVLLLEQGGLVGGCCSTFQREGYSFDLGASIVEVVDSVEEAFKMLGTTFQDEVELVECDPVYSCCLRDGSRVNIPRSNDGAKEALSRLSEKDASAWPGFASYASGFMSEVLKGFFTSPANTLGDMARIFREAPGMLAYRDLFTASYQDVLRRYFKDSRVQQTMGFQSFYVGLPPELAPGVFSILAYSEHEGVWYPKGGMIAIPEALRRCGEGLGMEYRGNTRVDRVLVRDRRVEGVGLADGTLITAPVVVSNVNARNLYLDLIGEEHLPRLARYGIKSYQPSMSAVMICLGVDYEPPLDAHHTIITAPFEEMNDYWWNRHLKGLLPEQQFGLVCWATKSDPSLAPEGCHVLNVIFVGPYNLGGTNWDLEKKSFLEKAIQYLSSTAVPGLSEHVKVAEIITPLDYERRLLMPRGAIYGLQQDITNQAVFRPASRSKSIKGLYLAGGSTHPGGGVPSVIGSGIVAARQIERHE